MRFLMQRGLFGALFIFLNFNQATAFLNIESLRQNLKEGFYGSTGLSLAGATGNVQTFDTGVTSQNIYKEHQREYLFIADYEYGEAKKVRNDNKGSLHTRYSQGFLPHWAWEVFAQVEFNEFQSLTLRSLLGGGFRVQLFRGEKNSVYTGFGTFYEDEDIKNDADQANFRGNIYLSLRSLISESVESVVVAYYQPSYKRVDDYRVQLTAGIETKLLEQLKLANNISYSTDSKPPQQIQKEDFTYKVVLNFSY